MEEPGKKMGDNAFTKLSAYFKRYNIKAKTGIKIKEFTKNSVVFANGSMLESDLILFIPGGSGHTVISSSDLPITEAGFIKINDNCKVDSLENVYAIGDISAIEGPPWAAKQGHVAEVMADVASHNIHNHIINNKSRKGYQSQLNIVCIMDTGDGAAFVYRKANFNIMIPLPIIGHWLKKGWGFYYRNSKLGKIPRITGL